MPRQRVVVEFDIEISDDEAAEAAARKFIAQKTQSARETSERIDVGSDTVANAITASVAMWLVDTGTRSTSWVRTANFSARTVGEAQ